MHRKSRLCAALLVAVVSVLSALSPASANKKEPVASAQSSTKASYDLARKAAVHHVAMAAKLPGSAWGADKVQLETGIELFDESDLVTAYQFNVKVGGQNAGYVIVGTELDWFPILEFAFQGQPYTSQSVESAKKNAVKVASGHKILYLGPTTYGVSVNHADGSSTTVSLRDRKVLKKKSGVNRPRPEHPTEARRYWDEVQKMEIGNPGDGVTDVDPSTWETGPYVTNQIAGVPAWDQWEYYYDSQGRPYWTGCSPTAAADIMEYWKNNGYPNMAVITNNQVVFDLRTAMGTTNSLDTSCDCFPGATSTSKISPGMQSYARGRGYSTATSTFKSAPTFDNFVGEVNNGRPALIGVDNHSWYEDHSLTSVGFIRFYYSGSSTGHEYLMAHDNHGDGVDVVYLTYGNYYSAIQLHTFRPQ